MVTTGVFELDEAQEAIGNASSEEQSFYALCHYLDLLQDDHNLFRSVERQIKSSENNLYLKVANTLLHYLNTKKETPKATWSQIVQSSLKPNDLSILSMKPNMSAAVGRKVHSLLPETPTRKDKTIVCINKKLHFSLKGRENRPFYKPRKSDEPYKILEILVTNHREKKSPVSSGTLAKEIYGTVTKANQVASTINRLRKKQFIPKLKYEFIANSSGYYLNDDILDIEIEKG